MTARRVALLLLPALALGLMPGRALAQFTLKGTALAVEEEWELIVSAPDPNTGSPQVATSMSLVTDTSEPYYWFMINLRSDPNPTAAGGLQVQLCSYANQLLGSSTWGTATLATANETINWRQRLTLSGGQVTYQITAGTSTTWGTFADTKKAYTVSYTPTIKDFSKYDPTISASESRVICGTTRVTSMTLKAVRQYDSKGTLISTWTANIPVDLTLR